MFRRKLAADMDMTEGSLLPKILLFSLPLMLTGILQLLYNAADIVVVGNFAGPQALAAVGSTSSLINLLTNLFMGLSVGASVLVARYHGARDGQAVSEAVHTSMTLSAVAGVLVGVIGYTLSRPMLVLMGSPEDVIESAALYVRIYFLGMPFCLIYNFGAAILRAIGDTKRPLIYLSIAGIVNVLLNLILVIVFQMSVAGVAIATDASQLVSMVLVLRCLLRHSGTIHLDIKRLGFKKKHLMSILQIGLPAGLQSSLFSVSNVMIQSAVNSFGSIVMAGNAASANLEGFVYTAMNSLYQADMTFASANYGAGKYSRVRSTLWRCLGTVIVVGLVLGGGAVICGRQLVSIYNSDPQVIRYGLLRLGVIMPVYFICGMMDTMVGQMRGLGYSVIPMIVSLSGACLFRIIWIQTIFAANPALNVLYISYPISWTLTFAVHMLTYQVVKRKLPTVDVG